MVEDLRLELKIGFISLGCPKNQLDCELMLARAEDLACVVTTRVAEADVIVVNTCCFIQPAIDEARAGIREALRHKSHGRCRLVVVAGCLSQYWGKHAPEEYPQVDAWLTPDNPLALGDVIARFQRGRISPSEFRSSPPEFLVKSEQRRVVSTPPSLAYLKIAEGCNHSCRFCLIPRLRGRYRSRSRQDIRDEFNWLVARGTPEIVLVSQDSTYYGADWHSGGPQLAELLEELIPLAGDAWVRVMYLHPAGITPELLQRWHELGPSLLPYFDLPLQHVNAGLLKSMGRRGGAAEYASLLDSIRQVFPDAIVRTSLIVGYPGETEAQFVELLRFVETGVFDRLGVFCYSELPGMASAKLNGKVPELEKEKRRLALMQVQEQITEKRNQAMIGTRLDVVLEGCEPLEAGGGWRVRGRSWRDAYEIDGLVWVNFRKKPQLFQRVFVGVTGTQGYDLMARLVKLP